MKKVCIFLSEGFEEVEAITVIDLLRRAKIEVVIISISENVQITGRSGIKVLTDHTMRELDISNCDGIILPGGMPGTENLYSDKKLCESIVKFNNEGKLIAAICAAPVIFGRLGLLNGRRACCYPGMESELTGAVIEENSVASDGNIINSKGVGTAIDFSKALIEYLAGIEKAREVMESIVYKNGCNI